MLRRRTARIEQYCPMFLTLHCLPDVSRGNMTTGTPTYHSRASGAARPVLLGLLDS